MANITVSISKEKLQFAIAFIEGYKSGNPKTTKASIERALAELGYTPIELFIIDSTETTAIVEAVFNPPVHHRTGKGKAKKATTTTEVKSTVDADEPAHGWDSDVDETLEDENVLGV